MKIVLATRGSKLALWQAHATRALLLALDSKMQVELFVVQSSGDRDQHIELASLGRIGVFTAEVDAAVASGAAHAAVHSLKDMTTSVAEPLMLAGVLARGPVEDVLVARDGAKLADLPRGARVATGSVRRVAMLKRVRRDLEIVGMRGNVDTRLAKLAAGDIDALVLARAGLVRLGLAQHVTEIFDARSFVPAVGQGIVGLTCRANDAATARTLASISDREAWAEAQAERALLNELHGGCNAPVGGHARAVEGAIALHARVLSADGTEMLEGELSGAIGSAAEIGRKLAQTLAARGARRLIEACRAR